MSASNVPYDANEFTGKRILVTGGSKGIGEAIVNRLRRAGGTVLATARTIPAGGHPEQFIQADVSTRAGADHIIKTTFDRLGPLDILINSVGGSCSPGGGVLALTDDISAARVRVESVFSRAPGSRLSSRHAQATFWRHHPCLIHSANAPIIRSYLGLRRRQSRSHHLRQRTLERSESKRHSLNTVAPGFTVTESADFLDGAAGGASGDGHRCRESKFHGFAWRHSARTPLTSPKKSPNWSLFLFPTGHLRSPEANPS